MKASNIFFLILTILIVFYLKNLNLAGLDVAYPKAFENSSDFSTFNSFILSQGFPSITLWLYYVFSNFIGLNYEISHYILSIIYVYFALNLSFLAKSKLPKNMSNILIFVYPLFFILGQFGLALLLSAEKMLLGMIFLQQAMKFSIKGNVKLKFVFYFLCIITHFTFILLVALLEYSYILKVIKKAFLKIISLKLNKSFIYLSVIPIVSLSIASGPIFNKFAKLLLQAESQEGFQNSYILLLISLFIIFFILEKPSLIIEKILGFTIFSIPILIGIGAGRIAWIYSFASINYLFVNQPYIQNPYKKIIYFSYLILLCLFYLFKSYVRIKAGSLQI